MSSSFQLLTAFQPSCWQDVPILVDRLERFNYIEWWWAVLLSACRFTKGLRACSTEQCKCWDLWWAFAAVIKIYLSCRQRPHVFCKGFKCRHWCSDQGKAHRSQGQDHTRREEQGFQVTFWKIVELYGPVLWHRAEMVCMSWRLHQYQVPLQLSHCVVMWCWYRKPNVLSMLPCFFWHQGNQTCLDELPMFN